MRSYFYAIALVGLGVLAALMYLHLISWWVMALALILTIIGMWDSIQPYHAVRRNFPVVGNLRYFFEFIRPELQQYFVESNLDGRPISREARSLIYQRAKGANQALPFGTQRDVYAENYEWMNHSIYPANVDEEDLFVTIGGKDCKQPYRASRFNISAMSFGALSPNAIRALNLGAKKGGFFHNTGEGGISSYHLAGGDLVWQIGTGYFGCRNEDGSFNAKAFEERSNYPQVKMIEIKLSQGAKPGKGGILPAAKVSEEISKIRLVPPRKTVISPPGHSVFGSARELIEFVAKLRDLSGGKPIGFKLCVGKKSEFLDICRAMLVLNTFPDFITVDGAEGGTGAAPVEFSNHVGTPLSEGLHFVSETLRGFGIKGHIKIIASGRVFDAFQMLKKLTLGADAISSARGMMMALGCIQALRCHTNHCPVGVATTDPRFYKGLHVPSKAERVAAYHAETMKELKDLLMASGSVVIADFKKEQLFRRVIADRIHSFEEIYPTISEGVLLNSDTLPEYWRRFFYLERPASSSEASDLPVST